MVAPPRLRPLRRAWPALLALAVLAAALLVETRDRGAAEDLVDLGQMGLYAVATGLALRAAVRAEDPGQRRAWAWLAVAAGLALLAYVALLSLAAAGQPVPQGDDLIGFLVVVNALAFVGLVLLSPPELARRSRPRVALDGLIVGGSLFFVVLVTTEWVSARGSALVDLLYPAIDAAALTVVGLAVLHRRSATPPWYRALAAGVTVVFVLDSLFASGARSIVLVDGASLLYLGLVGTAALACRPWEPLPARPEPMLAQWAVYVPFALAAGCAAYDYAEHDGMALPLFALLLALVGLLVARTLLLLRENRDLSASLRASDAFKTQLLRFISHEIANPLSPLKVQLRILRRGSEEAKGWEAVDRSLGRLESLSRDVRLMALAETGRLVQATQPQDVVPRVRLAGQAHEALAQARGLALSTRLPPGPLMAPVDGERFDQVVDNLLSNALKFTPRGGRVELRLAAAPEAAVLEVEDTGLGLDAAQQAVLFTAFGRAHGDGQPGLGLGLYLCKAIVDGHGGAISAASPGRGLGSTFRVEWPFAAAKGTPPPPPPGGPPPAYATEAPPPSPPEAVPAPAAAPAPRVDAPI